MSFENRPWVEKYRPRILDEIVTDVKTMHKPDEIQLDEIRDRLTHLITTIHTHENVENELIQQLYKNRSQ